MSKSAIAGNVEVTSATPLAVSSWRSLPARTLRFLREHALTTLELAVILIWAVIITRPYLNFDTALVPSGREYLQHLSNSHLWTRAEACGLCALWNGSVRGGFPAFADVQSSALHPVVIVTTLLFGVVNGGKVMLLLAFFTAGLGQWWLGRSLRLPRLVGLWTALMAVAGGHLAGRMEGGVLGLVLALASCSLALAAAVALVQNGTRRCAVLFAVALALALLSGQGYMQIGFLLLLPVVAVLIVGGPVPPALVLRRLSLGVGLSLLLAAPLIVPALHFLPEFSKNIDSQFTSAQPLQFTVLNLLVDDGAFYRTEVLGKMPFPAIYASFIGWIPLLFAIWGLDSRSVTGSARHSAFLGLTALGALWLASAEPLAWLAHTIQIPAVQGFIYGLRFTPLFTGLAVPPILALAGIGVARLLVSKWPQVKLGYPALEDEESRGLQFSLKWLIIIPLVLALREVYLFGRQYIQNSPVSPGIGLALDALQTPDLQWVDPPFGEQFWMEAAVARNLKASAGTQGWSWAGREPPLPVRELSRSNAAPEGMTLVRKVAGLNVYAAGPGREYAAVRGSGGSRSVCRAHGIGGDIDINCDALASGILMVEENFWPGWQAAVDGRPASVSGPVFMHIPVPAGAHTITLRYRPPDVFAGIALALAGIVLAIYLWVAKDHVAPAPVEAA